MAQALISSIVRRPAVITIASDANFSAVVAALGCVVIGLELPTVWTTSNITFQGSTDGGTTFRDVCDEDNNLVVFTAVAQNQFVMTLPATPILGGFTHIKLKSVTNQAANRTVQVLFGVSPNQS